MTISRIATNILIFGKCGLAIGLGMLGGDNFISGTIHALRLRCIWKGIKIVVRVLLPLDFLDIHHAA